MNSADSKLLVSRRRVLAASGVLVLGSLAGCLSRVASTVTNTGSSPAAVFAGVRSDGSDGPLYAGGPHVSRLTPAVSGGQLGDVKLEGWVTSSAVMAQDYNSSRSNKQKTRAADEDSDSDGDGIGDGSEEDAELVAYLDGKPIVAERFTVCLPDAEVPGGNGSIREEVTPERLIAYLTGEVDSEGRVYSWGTPKAGPSDPDTSSDCDDDDPSSRPGAACGTTPHFVAEVTGPVSTDGSMKVVRTEDGSVFLLSGSAPESEAERACESGGQGRVGMLTMRECGQAGWPEATESGSSTGVSVFQVMVQPPRCPRPFPALLYVQRCESDDQLVYTGGWVIDDASLYDDSVTVLSMVGPTEVVGVERSDLGGSFEDVAGGAADWESPRGQRGARLDSGSVEELVKMGVLPEQGSDVLVRKRPGREAGDDEVTLEVTGDEYGFVTHVAVDAPILHLVGASRASQDVKFKAGAELSKSVN